MTALAAAGVFLTGVTMASVGQVLLKKGAVRGRRGTILASFLDPYVLAGYTLMLASTITSTIALKVLPLSLTVALQPVGYVLVVLLSVTVLSERMRRRHVLGALVILLGVVIFNLESL